MGPGAGRPNKPAQWGVTTGPRASDQKNSLSAESRAGEPWLAAWGTPSLKLLCNKSGAGRGRASILVQGREVGKKKLALGTSLPACTLHPLPPYGRVLGGAGAPCALRHAPPVPRHPPPLPPPEQRANAPGLDMVDAYPHVLRAEQVQHVHWSAHATPPARMAPAAHRGPQPHTFCTRLARVSHAFCTHFARVCTRSAHVCHAFCTRFARVLHTFCTRFARVLPTYRPSPRAMAGDSTSGVPGTVCGPKGACQKTATSHNRNGRPRRR